MQSRQVVIYTRAHCGLCDDAVRLVRELGFEPELIDIDHDESLRSQFNTCVPVVAIDGRVRFRGRISPVLLRRQLTSPS